MATFKLHSDTATVLENGSKTGNVLLNDSLANQVTQIKAGSGSFMPVPIEGVTIQGIYGFLTIMSDGSYSYTASTDAAERLKAGSTASDTFTYAAVGGGSGTSTLKFTVTGVNDAPVLTSTSASLNTITEDQTTNSGHSVSSFLSSTDIDSSALRGIAITDLASGNGQWQYSTDSRATWSNIGAVNDGSALLLRSSDYIRFVPNGANGTTANFTYHAWDQTSGSAGAKVDASTTGGQAAFSTGSAIASITVTNVNDAPVAQPSSASGIEDGPPITGQVKATDVDSTTLTYALVANSAVGGSVTVDAATGDYSFTPAANFNGAASFKFTASDGSLTSTAATVTIAIASVNDGPPVANTDNAGTYADTPVLIDVLANDTDIDGDALSISALGTAGHGSVQIQNGKVLYTPAAGYTGDDAFTYTVSDGAGGTDQGNVNVTVAPIQSDAPIAVSVTFSQGANGYSDAIDTMLRQNRASIPFADASFFRSILESGKESQPLLKFGNVFGSGSGQIPIGATILSASLTLEVTDGSASGGSINRMLVGWSSTSTWNSLGSGVQINGIEATSTGINVGSISKGSHAFDVTESLAAWNAAASTSAGQNAANFGWVFKPTNIDSWDFNSAQGAVKPVLSVTYTQAGVSLASLPNVSIGAVATAHENDGKITFSLSLSQASTHDVTVNLGTSDFTAKSGADYGATSSSITFSPGELTKTFDVNLLNDGSAERLEFFNVQINSATNAQIDKAIAVGKITDDDVIVPPMPAINASVVAVHNISDATKYDGGPGYGISDPSGIAYIPSMGKLLIADSEHDESPFYSNINLFSLQLDGSYAGNYSLTSFSSEPTGLAYNPNNGYLYIPDDDQQEVFWVSPSNPSVKLGSFDTGYLGLLDTEDIKVDPVTGHIHMLDGVLKQMIELTDRGVFVNSVSLPSVMKDAEALAYDPTHDVYFVASGASSKIWAIDPQANILGTIDVLSSYSPTTKIKGMELAPSSDPNDGNALSLYVADYGADQQNDGRLFEIHLGNDWLFNW
ncbi:Ig-like domain-containing protein [Sphingobium sp. TKS]|uniref:Ig-like domain-containing protein n=1 Tax=Sphingobium sp. TKS TaxID=1315974 RepID=UPI0007706AD9|nr:MULTISPECIES: Ig-like domain-containing protein [Sphingomonadaceae]AMK25196.1 hemagglutinin/hemolysin-like protein [Sphingobium sp. TKS]